MWGGRKRLDDGGVPVARGREVRWLLDIRHVDDEVLLVVT